MVGPDEAIWSISVSGSVNKVKLTGAFIAIRYRKLSKISKVLG